jgi:hypothetical protein
MIINPIENAIAKPFELAMTREGNGVSAFKILGV